MAAQPYRSGTACQGPCGISEPRQVSCRHRHLTNRDREWMLRQQLGGQMARGYGTWEDRAMENTQVQGMRLGRTPKRDDPRSLKLDTLLPGAIPQPPAAVDVSTGVTKWPMYANDHPGDCTCAAF